MRHRGYVILALVAALAGTGLGLWYGWEIDPLQYTDKDMTHLHAAYRDEFLSMVSEAYALDGDLFTARARIAMLALPDPPQTVADLAERAIARQAPLSQIQALARLAAALGVQRDTLRPYLPSLDEAR